ncbi:MAG TPA: hypothetical protein PKO06_24125, partial [Candidatus Ozemobacteraceae bacterium]|nr:hypothetical protein [Candidatus Ozemobacteraceae bacterium]
MKRLLLLLTLGILFSTTLTAAEQTLVPGTSQRLHLSKDVPKAAITFWYPASRAVAVRVKANVPGTDVSLSGKREEKFGSLKVAAKFQDSFVTDVLADECFDSIPPLPGTWTIELTLRGRKPDTSLEISLEEVGVLP